MQLNDIRSGGKRAVARALSQLDRAALSENQATLLDEAFASPQGRVIGLTGPPGVGKSTLTQALIERLRADSQSVAVIAVDPSSQSTGGALLGDRTRLSLDPEDRQLFVRSLAARHRLGGLSDHAIAAAMLLRALYDVVLVETVGIGQSDADVALIADTSLLCVQPGSGDALQFMKAGIMEWPDVIAVTKADTGPMARRARADVEGALGLAAFEGGGPLVHLVSAKTGDGVGDLITALTSYTLPSRASQAANLLRDAIARRFGTHGLSRLETLKTLESADGPFGAIFATSASFSRHT
jgi:LAO/AO transport system kinase